MPMSGTSCAPAALLERNLANLKINPQITQTQLKQRSLAALRAAVWQQAGGNESLPRKTERLICRRLLPDLASTEGRRRANPAIGVHP